MGSFEDENMLITHDKYVAHRRGLLVGVLPLLASPAEVFILTALWSLCPMPLEYSHLS